MSVVLKKETTVGKECPVCRNLSVFEEQIYRCFGLSYSHTIETCEMGNCNYKINK